MTNDRTHRGSYDAGLEIRREVLGDAHVQRSLETASDFARPIQELVTAYAWGEIWSRPGLGRRERSLINIAMLTALNRGNELRGHIRGALNNGVTVSEIQEVLLQTAVYVGMPAALEAFRVAEAEIAEISGA